MHLRRIIWHQHKTLITNYLNLEAIVFIGKRHPVLAWYNFKVENAFDIDIRMITCKRHAKFQVDFFFSISLSLNTIFFSIASLLVFSLFNRATQPAHDRNMYLYTYNVVFFFFFRSHSLCRTEWFEAVHRLYNQNMEQYTDLPRVFWVHLVQLSRQLYSTYLCCNWRSRLTSLKRQFIAMRRAGHVRFGNVANDWETEIEYWTKISRDFLMLFQISTFPNALRISLFGCCK